MSCYVLGDEMSGRDRTEDRKGHQKNNRHTLYYTDFLCVSSSCDKGLGIEKGYDFNIGLRTEYVGGGKR